MDKNKQEVPMDKRWTRLEILTRMYNEQVNFLVRTECDMDFLNYLMLAEPLEKSHTEKKANTTNNFKRGSKFLAIVTKAIEKEKNGKTN